MLQSIFFSKGNSDTINWPRLPDGIHWLLLPKVAKNERKENITNNNSIQLLTMHEG